MSRRRVFQRAADELLRAGLHTEALCLRNVQAADLDTSEGIDVALAGFRALADRVHARRVEADDSRQVAESSSASAPFELRGYLRVRVAMLSDCERALNAVEQNLLKGAA